MLVKPIKIIFLSTVICFNLSAQDLKYVKAVVQTLASKEFKGRGYVDKGEKKAAEFIRDEFKNIGLLQFNQSYDQQFDFPVNTFPGKMNVRIDGVTKKTGVEYLIDPGSPGIKGDYPIIHIEIEELLGVKSFKAFFSAAKDCFIMIPAYEKNEYSDDERHMIDKAIRFFKYNPDNPAAGTIIETTDKLTWSGSTALNTKPTLILKADANNQETERITLNVKNKFVNQYTSRNVIGYLEGDGPDSIIVFTAHYDHLGMMGSETIFPGANDNASGVAMLLNLAKYYSKNKPAFDMLFIAFGGEELGLIGSSYFVKNPLVELSRIKFLLNFDIAGTGDDGIQVVNGSVHKKYFNILNDENERYGLLPSVKTRGEACNSDHCMFHLKKVPCFFIYTLGGIQAYHDIYDQPETLPLTEFEDYFKLIKRFIEKI